MHLDRTVYSNKSAIKQLHDTKIGTKYTRTLHRIRIRPYIPEQRIPDVAVRPNEDLPDTDVKVSHNEWYAVSWETDFGKQNDEHETPENADNNQKAVIQEVTNMNDESTTQQRTTNQTENANGEAPPSPDFSNLTTDVGDNPYIRRTPPIESPPNPTKSPPTVIGYNPRKKTKYNLRPNPKPNADPDFRRLDAMTTTQKEGKGAYTESKPNRSDNINYGQTTASNSIFFSLYFFSTHIQASLLGCLFSFFLLSKLNKYN